MMESAFVSLSISYFEMQEPVICNSNWLRFPDNFNGEADFNMRFWHSLSHSLDVWIGPLNLIQCRNISNVGG